MKETKRVNGERIERALFYRTLIINKIFFYFFTRSS